MFLDYLALVDDYNFLLKVSYSMQKDQKGIYVHAFPNLQV